MGGEAQRLKCCPAKPPLGQRDLPADGFPSVALLLDVVTGGRERSGQGSRRRTSHRRPPAAASSKFPFRRMSREEAPTKTSKPPGSAAQFFFATL